MYKKQVEEIRDISGVFEDVSKQSKATYSKARCQMD
jgi:hypothetical protein